MKNKIIILSDEIQSGKTTFLKEFCKKQNNVGGILTPVVNEKRMIYDITNKSYFDMEASEKEKNLSVGKYIFSESAFAKAQNIILTEIENKNLNYLIIDEIGPLEIIKRKGFYEVLNTILKSTFTFTLILVVRKKLITDFATSINLQNLEILSLEKITEKFIDYD
jgi:nucleoside-triphosphatase THEP1